MPYLINLRFMIQLHWHQLVVDPPSINSFFNILLKELVTHYLLSHSRGYLGSSGSTSYKLDLFIITD